MELNTSERILTLKVVYYGTAMGGKTTNLQTIHSLTDREQRTELISIATRDDRTLFFDLLPVGLGKFFGFELRLKLFTVPGQVQFDVTRRKVLAGSDAVVFVADSQAAQADGNALSLKNLGHNLQQNKIDPKTMPVILQYNKRDLPGTTAIEEMEASLNDKRLPSFPAVATKGWGVMECLGAALAIVVETLVANHKLAPAAEAKRAAGQVREALLSFKPETPPLAEWAERTQATPDRAIKKPEDATWVHKAGVNVTDEVDVLEQAVEANLALSERLTGLKAVASKVERRERQIQALGSLARLADEVAESERIERELLSSVLAALGLERASLLARPAAGGVAVRFLAGHRADPLSSIASPPMTSLAERMIASGRPVMSNDVLTEIFFGEPRPEVSGLYSLLFAPLQTTEGLFLYGRDPDEPFDASDGLFVEAACRIVSLVRLRAAVGAGRG
jgi:signal recognition particle receptor subunit beta